MSNEVQAPVAYGEMKKQGDAYSVRFERDYPYPVAMVWDAISNPEAIGKWLADATIDMREGGDIVFMFKNYPETMHGRITELKPLSVLEYTWQEKTGPESLVRWELYPEGPEHCRMVLLHTKLGDNMPSFGGGWHEHLRMMEGVMSGSVTAFAWDEPAWMALREYYKKAMAEL